MQCKICSSQASIAFNATILNKYKNVPFFYCNRCEFLSTQEPVWLEESYSKAISALDTGLAHRNLSMAYKVSTILHCFFDKKGQFLDFGGGIGLFTRLMRDRGFDFYWQDLYAKNEVAQGFSLDDVKNKHFELTTTFECFEHFVNPMAEVDRILQYSSSFLFTTLLLPDPVPRPHDWWYYTLESGQHIAFYRKKTLEFIASKHNLNFYTNNRMHLITDKKINPLAYNSVLKISRFLSYFYVSRTMKSMLWTDRTALQKKMSMHNESL